jgi:hypothetical protein
VDITQQQYAFHHIYVQRLVKPRTDDIVIPILQQYLQIHTGQMYALPIVMFRKKYRRMLRHIPMLLHLCHLLMKLPALHPHKVWSAEWVMDLPLCTTLLAPTDDQKGISNIPIRFRISDVLNGDDQTNCFYLASYDNQSQYTRIQIIRKLQKRQIAWQSWLRPALGDDNILLERTEDLLPNCNHWTTKFTDKTTQIGTIKLSDLRQTWNKQDHWIRNPPHPPTRIPPA